MNILTFDIEEWFHILDNDSTKTEKEWSNFESRIHKNVDVILESLARNDSRATFFCLGWIAEKYPEVIRLIAEKYEIGSHTSLHQLVYEQNRKAFKNDVESSIKRLEDITGKKVKYFRAPGFSIREAESWAFEILSELGVEVDSSVFPAPRAHGGFSTYSAPLPSLIKCNGVEIKELPINYASVLGKPVIFSGGGYFRLFPYWLIKKWTMESNYVMSYLHPRDFDFKQPVIKELSLPRKFKSYVGLKGASAKLDRWLSDFDFIDIDQAVNNIDWKNVPVFKI